MTNFGLSDFTSGMSGFFFTHSFRIRKGGVDNMVLTSGSYAKIEANLRESFKRIKQEMCDHLESINENTTEIQDVYRYMADIDVKLDKLSERIDTLASFAREFIPRQNILLEPVEQKIFLLLYTYGEREPISIYELASKLSLSIALIKQSLQNMETKGVRFIKDARNQDIYVSLNEEFKEIQARDNVVLLDENMKRAICRNNSLLAFIN